ncbi:hypothetical protein [Neobacillus sp. Marseille-QA0830]
MDKPNKEVLAVKIHNAVHKDGKDYYEATRGNWRANKDRACAVEYVIGILDQQVVCAYKPDSWETIEESGKQRQRFEGKEVDQATFNRLKEMEEELLKGFGSQASISYKKL